jgi:hypothetical protein
MLSVVIPSGVLLIVMTPAREPATGQELEPEFYTLVQPEVDQGSQTHTGAKFC